MMIFDCRILQPGWQEAKSVPVDMDNPANIHMDTEWTMSNLDTWTQFNEIKDRCQDSGIKLKQIYVAYSRTGDTGLRIRMPHSAVFEFETPADAMLFKLSF